MTQGVIPPIKEQVKINDLVRREILDHRYAEAQIERRIRGLEEYRAALITAAVTGQIPELR